MLTCVAFWSRLESRLLHPIARSTRTDLKLESPTGKSALQAAMLRGLPRVWQSKEATALGILLPRWKSSVADSHTLQGPARDRVWFLKWNGDSWGIGFPSHKVTKQNSCIEFCCCCYCCCLSLFWFLFILLLLLFPFKPSRAFAETFSPYSNMSVEGAVFVFCSCDTLVPES